MIIINFYNWPTVYWYWSTFHIQDNSYFVFDEWFMKASYELRSNKGVRSFIVHSSSLCTIKDLTPLTSQTSYLQKLYRPAAYGQLRTFVTNINDSQMNSVWLIFNRYVFLRLATPINPSNPEPNNQTAGGIGTKDVDKESIEKCAVWKGLSPISPCICMNP